jgi:hypothetical protein
MNMQLLIQKLTRGWGNPAHTVGYGHEDIIKSDLHTINKIGKNNK